MVGAADVSEKFIHQALMMTSRRSYPMSAYPWAGVPGLSVTSDRGPSNRLASTKPPASKILRGGTDASDALKQKEQRHFIERALKLLSPDDVTMITLFYLKENSLEEIAESIGIETNTVKVKLHRARKRLAEAMQDMMKGEQKSLL